MITTLFTLHPFSFGIFLMALLVTVLILLFSFKSRAGRPHNFTYYGYVLLALGCVTGALFASDYVTLLLFWGMLGIPLYMLVGIDDADGRAAQKALTMVGGADILMIFGVGLVWLLTHSLQIGSVPLYLNNIFAVAAFLALLTGAFAKAGVMPLHSWIPSAAKAAPAEVMALLPASLDKLLGIYFLTRICFNIFIIVPNSPMSIFLLSIGSITIIAAVLGAFVQHDLKKLLAFHAVSQVGYMVIGIGTGLPIGVAGGVFHMFNNALYKTCLFLCAGSVEKQTGTEDMGRLGGLAKFMPLTFTAFVIAAFSISGVPPFNGFVSKWMIYQALTQFIRINPFWIVPLLAAMFGSAFTLASFMKFMQSVFLGQWVDDPAKVKEVPWQMWLPPMVLAGVCVLFGLFAFQFPLKYLVFPSISNYRFLGLWQPSLALWLLLIGLVIGLLIYALGTLRHVVVRPPFYGGEKIDEREMKLSGAFFYDAIRGWGALDKIYSLAEKQRFDFYIWVAGFFFVFSYLAAALERGLNLLYALVRANLILLLIGMIMLELAVEGFLFKLGERELMTALTGTVAVVVLGWLMVKLREQPA